MTQRLKPVSKLTSPDKSNSFHPLEIPVFLPGLNIGHITFDVFVKYQEPPLYFMLSTSYQKKTTTIHRNLKESVKYQLPLKLT